MDQDAPLDSAQFYVSLGWSVFPVRLKAPLTEHGFLDATTDAEQISTWWGQRWPDAGIAVATGASGYVVLDLDRKPGVDGSEALFLLEQQYGKLPETIRQTTGGGGSQLFFRAPPGVEIRNSASKLGDGIDVRAVGGYVIVPPSMHASGNRYTWDIGRAPEDVPDVPVLPAWVAGLLTRETTGDGYQKADPIPEKLTEGKRNSGLASLAGTLRRRGLTPEQLYGQLRQFNADNCTPPLSDQEVRQIAESIGRYATSHEREQPPDEDADAGKGTDATATVKLADTMRDVLTYLRGEATDDARLIETPWPTLNHVLGGGFSRGELAYLGAWAGIGKSVLGANVAVYAGRNGYRVLVFSLELSRQMIGVRILSAESKVPLGRLRPGYVLDRDWEHIDKSVGDVSKLQISTCTAQLTVKDLGALVATHKPDVLIVDYLQLVTPPAAIREKRLQIEAISAGLKAIAHGEGEGHGPFVLAMSSLSRPNGVQDPKPHIWSLRESGALEHDADVVLLLHRPDSEPQATEIIVAKNRNGPTSAATLNLIGAFATFEEPTPSTRQVGEDG